MKDLLIFGLLAYIIYDRYVRDEEYELLKNDINKISMKINEVKENI